MAIEFLSTKDQDIVLRCMKSTASFIDDCEKHTRLGIEGDELERLIKQWPDIDDRDQTGSGFLAINNCMNEVCHGFRIAVSEWATGLTGQWKKSRPHTEGGLRSLEHLGEYSRSFLFDPFASRKASPRG
jgi:hypothetical protein